MKALKSISCNYSCDILDDLPKGAKEAYDTLCEAHNQMLIHATEEAIVEEVAAYTRWIHVAELEDEFYKQKSKLHWLQIGDQTNKFSIKQ